MTLKTNRLHPLIGISGLCISWFSTTSFSFRKTAFFAQVESPRLSAIPLLLMGNAEALLSLWREKARPCPMNREIR
jgi:hypothetical protein